MYDHAYWQAAECAATEPDAAPTEKKCDMPGCTAAGLFKAPKSPQELRSYRWFCQPHVQEYNKAWNYFAGLNPDQMEQVRREDVVGWRPTWPLGHLRANGQAAPQIDVNALRKHIFRRFFSGKMNGERTAAAKHQSASHLTPEETQALSRLGLQWPTNMYELKSRYRALIKKHHPDRMPGHLGEATAKDAAHETIMLINRAYAVLKRKLAVKG